ncbi:MAG: D-tyrosyl-tRNA(Tyr) deacylase [Saprospiraceae bacterium]|nr:D-tyrosyl-tRNA(Tyr) deacylase [Saprospiraceae bacterium]
MRCILQRVLKASVTIDNQQFCEIQQGLLIFLGIEQGDQKEDLDWLVNKILSLRIFSDSNQQMNLSINDIQGELLIISQFTLFASTKKGNRPGFSKAAKPEEAKEWYIKFISECEKLTGKPIKTGIFVADMKIQLINDGPVTIYIDTKNKE